MMNTRSAINQKRADHSRARSSSSQARSLLHGWTPAAEATQQPDAFEGGPPISGFTRGLPRRNRALSGQRPPAPPYEDVNRNTGRKRGPSLVARAKELMNQSRTHTTTASSSSSSFRRLPDQQSRHDESASEDEKARLAIESNTPCFNLIQRWKDPTDWLKPSNYWKKTHPAMNFRLWRIIARDPRNHWKLKASAERNLADATRLYEQKGGDSGEWWPGDLEEEALDSWALGFGGQDPPRRKWRLEE